MKVSIALLLGAAIFAGACGRNSNATQQNTNQTKTTDVLGAFNADSAYSYIDHQVAFGPRVPGSEAHRQCRDWLIASLKRFGADTVYVQDAQVKAYNGDKLPITNIIASYNSGASKRVLLAAHWDSRPWADKAFDANDRTKPVPGANDGGSGVGVLLEIARNLAARQPSVGVDIAFFDAEDYGKYEGFEDSSDTWCLGSQYWAKNMIPYSAYNKPVYGILLDMVGGRGARFHYELFSQEYARLATVKVWGEAEKLGYSDYFIREKGAPVTDDHVVLTRAGIPTTNIIESINSETQSFNPTWHTLDDTMANIDRASLKAVGETVLNVVYKERP
ncbi:MAG: M28 family peptidase [Muribaculaceae bacterium]|jgi:Predicted aminopeptidases|nr:M28 family peptidase [Muribaculaceae bacterium]